jgi:hypothetical protein
MEKFNKEATPKTPHIDFDPTTGKFLLEGRSIPEDSRKYYKPLVEWIEDYNKHPCPNTVLSVNLEYFNTSTSKCLVEIFRKLERIHGRSEVKILWHYDEEDMMESGEDFRKILKIPIELKKVEN